MLNRSIKRPLACGLGAIVLCLGANAQAAYPDRPISLVVNFTAGGPLDMVARLLAAKAGGELHQTVIVENKPGASGTIGGEYVARAKPDGYTLLIAVDTLVTVNPFVYKNNHFDPRTTLSTIGRCGSFNLGLVTRTGLGPTDLKQFVAMAGKQHLSYASAGAASPGHLAMEAFRLGAHTQMTHIPYKGNAPAVNALLAGQVDSGFLSVSNMVPNIRAHKLVALAVSGKTRDPLLPEVPTIAESGLPGMQNFDMQFGFVLMAPKNTPKDIIVRWNGLLNKFLQDPDVLAKLKNLDIQPTIGTPEQAEQTLSATAKQWQAVIEQAHITAD
ncbi:tripartite tricarboxylate transporter substrate binding protein [Candidimonas humi]|jgi:tripartite-type tricarboxylate transporter receptor subunit TctC|uniref:Bug family tripartite tricarboxylate transporter substrate binding protein n=1 Tax=Candidimonas humi TaxID=683355 RepID=A0ABV8P0Y3_9BURK|nr:tripartite tricarboxylate transporter substrate binding protein [Candidimonas humi]MBV6304118.1 tripartite tricarboxylate transporter substrate binding protein [Candidimonas humi]